MKKHPDIVPCISSTNPDLNDAITLLRVVKRVRGIDPTYSMPSKYETLIKNIRVAHLNKLHIVR